MKILITTFIVLVTALLTGCANPPNRLADALAQARACADQVSATPAGQIVASQVLFRDQTSGNRLELMINTNRPTPEQMAAFKEVISAAMQCRQPWLNAISGTGYYPPQANYYDFIDGVYLKLIKGEITIGEANTAKDYGIKQMASGMQAANAQINRNADEQRRQNALMLMPYLMQQPVYTPQPYIMQPAYVPPRQINTNCQTYGNTTNCTSR
jgi:hypothetical protein